MFTLSKEKERPSADASRRLPSAAQGGHGLGCPPSESLASRLPNSVSTVAQTSVPSLPAPPRLGRLGRQPTQPDPTRLRIGSAESRTEEDLFAGRDSSAVDGKGPLRSAPVHDGRLFRRDLLAILARWRVGTMHHVAYIGLIRSEVMDALRKSYPSREAYKYAKAFSAVPMKRID